MPLIWQLRYKAQGSLYGVTTKSSLPPPLQLVFFCYLLRGNIKRNGPQIHLNRPQPFAISSPASQAGGRIIHELSLAQNQGGRSQSARW
jgi:hypothetical protein